jgi:hypothetical protein
VLYRLKIRLTFFIDVADLAMAALHCVFERHAGYLQSYSSDENRRLIAADRIIRWADAQFGEVSDEHCAKDHYFEVYVRPVVEDVVRRLLKLAPEYMSEKHRGVQSRIPALLKVLHAFRREVTYGMKLTRYDRVQMA